MNDPIRVEVVERLDQLLRDHLDLRRAARGGPGLCFGHRRGLRA